MVNAPGTGTELRDQQRCAEHGDVLHEQDHLHLLHHGIAHAPESVQRRDADQEQDNQPGADFGAISQQDREPADTAVSARSACPEVAGRRFWDWTCGRQVDCKRVIPVESICFPFSVGRSGY